MKKSKFFIIWILNLEIQFGLAQRYTHGGIIYDYSKTGCSASEEGDDIYANDSCCTTSDLCGLHDADCDGDETCMEGLVCQDNVVQHLGFTDLTDQACVSQIPRPDYETCMEHNIDYPSNNIYYFDTYDVDECRQACIDTPGCQGATLATEAYPDPAWKGKCYLKSQLVARTLNYGVDVIHINCVPKCSMPGSDYQAGYDLSYFPDVSLQECHKACQDHQQCFGAIWGQEDGSNARTCWIKNEGARQLRFNNDWIAVPKFCYETLLDNWYRKDFSHYYFSDQVTSLSEAKMFCSNQNATLVELNSEEEHLIVNYMKWALSLENNIPNTNYHPFIGITSPYENWISEPSEIVYTQWCNPPSGNVTQGILYGDCWSYANENQQNHFICERCEPTVDGYVEKSGRYYKAINMTSTLSLILSTCERDGAQLAMFHRPEDKIIIEEIMAEKGIEWTVLGMNANPNGNIACNDADCNDKGLTWINGKPIIFEDSFVSEIEVTVDADTIGYWPNNDKLYAWKNVNTVAQRMVICESKCTVGVFCHVSDLVNAQNNFVNESVLAHETTR